MPKQSQGRFFYKSQAVDTTPYSNRAEALIGMLSDGLDHPELWHTLGTVGLDDPQVIADLHCMLHRDDTDQLAIRILLAISEIAPVDVTAAVEWLTPLTVEYDQSPLLQGALFFLHGLQNPHDAKYSLEGKICRHPFSELTITEGRSFLCCPSWLPTSVGDPYRLSASQIWNSQDAERIRQSIHDGSFRHCNKIVCPIIQSNSLPTKIEASLQSTHWHSLIQSNQTQFTTGPEVVNLCYDRTCNLSCPSCRAETFAADKALRGVFSSMQDRLIIPLLRSAKIVIVTGSGDPFASKNFRHLIRTLTPEDFPQLKFHLMTNGMLLTPDQWKTFPSLHQRVEMLKISVDAAFGSTHEKLRRGSKWETMLKNMTFAGQLAKEKSVEHYEISFVVQTANFREMGSFVDLARAVGATKVYFGRLMNWELFEDETYKSMAVFLPDHPEHSAFLSVMQDPRLKDPMVWLGNLQEFITI